MAKKAKNLSIPKENYQWDNLSKPPFETHKLREALSEFLQTEVYDVVLRQNMKLGNYNYGVYAFYDYDGEPIYVGQTSEKISTRVRRHLTNQRTDAVAMSVLDPFEVFEIEIWPLSRFQSSGGASVSARQALDALEATVFQRALNQSRFHAVLNEKKPESSITVPLPPSFRRRIVSDEVYELRKHPDTRIARRAATLARLAQVISERDVQVGLRKTLLTQAKRLQWLAERRIEHFSGGIDTPPDTIE